MTAIDELLAAIESGKGAATADLYSDDALLDATVPGWRFRLQGGEAIAAQYASWFADPAEFTELDRQPIVGGELVTYFMTWEEDGVPHGAHHSHTLQIDATTGLITHDRVFCGGRWPAGSHGQDGGSRGVTRAYAQIPSLVDASVLEKSDDWIGRLDEPAEPKDRV